MFGGFQVGPFQPAYQQDSGTVVSPGPVGGGGGGRIWYWPSKRKFRRLEDIIDDGLKECYEEILAKANKAEKAEAASIVKPFVESGRTLRLTPSPAAVDWTAMHADVIQARKLLELWAKAIREQELRDEDDDLMLLH